MNQPLRVVCIGGGYVAIYMARALRSAIRRGQIALTVIDRNNYHTFHGLVPEMLVGKIQAGQIISPARRLFAPGRFVTAQVDGVDVARKTVHLSRTLDGKGYEIPYDQLVVNVGSVDNLQRYRGIGEHTLRLKSYMDCITVRNHILAMFELADLETDAAERRRLLRFVVAGGNYAGIEVAAELAELVGSLLKREFPRLSRDEIAIDVVHGGAGILPELGEKFPRLARRAEASLRSHGVTLRLGMRLKSATPQEAVLSDGTRLPTRTIISCTGTASSPLLDDLPFPRDDSGRLIADPFGRVSEEHGVWSAGDCAAITMKDGRITPPLAIYAMQGGKTIGRNLTALVRGRRMKPYAFTGMGDACVLGHHDAVGQLWGIPLQGLIAWLVWRSCMILYLPSTAKRVRTLFDWATGPFLGRDVTSVTAEERMGVKNEVYEAGQDILRQGDVGTAMFIIRSGDVAVLRHTPEGGEEQLATLHPGDHFGEVAVMRDVRRTATVRAINAVEVLRISREGTRLLSEAFAPFGDSITLREPTADPAA